MMRTSNRKERRPHGSVRGPIFETYPFRESANSENKSNQKEAAALAAAAAEATAHFPHQFRLEAIIEEPSAELGSCQTQMAAAVAAKRQPKPTDFA